MSVAALRHDAVVTPRPMPRHAPAPEIGGGFRRAMTAAGDGLGLIGIVFCIPFAILAFALPIVLVLRGVLWIVGVQ